ncbi:MAG: hypothetical protein ABI281_00050 [Caldimonas sp.]
MTHRPLCPRRLAAVIVSMAAASLAACQPRGPAADTVQLPASGPGVSASASAAASAAAIAMAASAGASALATAAAAGHALAIYFAGGEVRTETAGQRRELRRALVDALTLPEAGLRAARYAGANGKRGQRDLAEVLRDHLARAERGGIDVAQVVAGRDTAEGAGALREALAALDRARVR